MMLETFIKVMLLHNLTEYSSNYSDTTGSLWFYSKNETTNFDAAIANIDSFIYIQYKASLLENIILES